MKTLLASGASLALLLTAGAWAAAAVPAPAASPTAAPVLAPNWYNVEVIVFRATDPDAGAGETWAADPGIPDWSTALALNAPDSVGQAVPYQALSPVGEQLGDAWTRLKRSKNYEPLLHVTWTQPISDRATAASVRIGVPHSETPAAGSNAPAQAVVPAPAAATGAAAAAIASTPAYGTAKLSTTGPYLHFDLDLVLQGAPVKTVAPAGTTINATLLTPATGSTAATLPALQLYRLRHDMRVNGGKVAYFDNPMFGAIVLVTPVRH